MTLLDHFKRAFVINLKERTDRRQEVERELARVEMPLGPGGVEVFPAIRPTTADGFRNAGSRGCYLSHLAVLERALAERAENVLVMEDDVAFSPRLDREVPTVLMQLRSHPWGLVHLGHGVPLYDTGEIRLVRYSEAVPLTHCYGVDGATLGPLVEFLRVVPTRPSGHPEGGPIDIDGALSMFRAQHPEVVTLLAAPSLATQRSSRSDLAPTWFDRVPALRDVATVARRVRRMISP